ncbi:MAG: mechanosensitive ion channel family protein [Cyanothece sp. SIO2G6]|nr:mechanosensitive ion channel family protein [Cyanothece sp. SIO2G6]
MNPEVINQILANASSTLVDVGLKVLGAIILWLVGRWLIKFAMTLLTRTLKQSSIETTLLVYLKSTIGILLNIVLVVAILGFFGIETTSFAAILAAAGVAIGAAWSGLLAHFAAGAFLIIFRPFVVGDFISAAGVTGTVEEIGLFVTTINTLDNVKSIVANNSIFSDNIQNFSGNSYRRVDLVAQLNHDVNPQDAIARLRERVGAIANIMTDPVPDIEILEFNLAGTVLAVRPYCSNDHYWQVYFDTNRAISEVCGEAGYSAPTQYYNISHKPAA